MRQNTEAKSSRRDSFVPTFETQEPTGITGIKWRTKGNALSLQSAGWAKHLFSLFPAEAKYRSTFMCKWVKHAWLFIWLIALSGCMTMKPLPKVNFSEPGWTVRQGQAVWRPQREAPEIAGELLVASRAD